MKKTFFVLLFIGLGLLVFANDLMLNISRTIGSTYQEVQQNLGKPLKESMITMPDGQTKRFLFYSGIQVHIGLLNGKEYLAKVIIFDPSIQLIEGVAVGVSLQEKIGSIGNDFRNSSGSHEFVFERYGLRNPYKLTLFKDVSGMIVRIEIENAMYWYG